MATPAAAATSEADPIGRVLLTTAKASGVLEAIEGSLLYLASKYEGARREKAAAQALADAPEESSAAREWKPGEPLPPASAGTNGTAVPPPPGSHGEPFVARIPATPN